MRAFSYLVMQKKKKFEIICRLSPKVSLQFSWAFLQSVQDAVETTDPNCEEIFPYPVPAGAATLQFYLFR